MRTMPTPALPGAVAMAAMVSERPVRVTASRVAGELGEKRGRLTRVRMFALVSPL